MVRGLMSPNPNTRWTVPLSLTAAAAAGGAANAFTAPAPPPPSTARAAAPSPAWSSQMLMRSPFFAKFDWVGLRSGLIPPPVVPLPVIAAPGTAPVGADELYLLYGPPKGGAGGADAVGEAVADEAADGGAGSGAGRRASVSISKSHFLQSTTASRLAQTEATKKTVKVSPSMAALNELANALEDGQRSAHPLKYAGDQSLFHDF